jgi:hypothetical protein
MKHLTLSENTKILSKVVLIPSSLKYAEGHLKTPVDKIVKLVDKANVEELDVVYKCDLLGVALREALLLMDEIVQKDMKTTYKHKLDIKKKDHLIGILKSFNDFQKDHEPSAKKSKTPKLSNAEKKILSTINR